MRHLRHLLQKSPPPAEIAAAFWLVVFFAVALGPMPIILEVATSARQAIP